MRAMKDIICLNTQSLRQKMRALHAAALAVSAALCFLSCGDDKKGEAAEVAAEIEAMGTIVSITAYASTADEGQAAVHDAEEEVRRLERLWSATDPESEISALNSSSGPVEVSEETAELIRFAKEITERTGGAFDPTVLPVVKAWGFLTQQYRVPSDEEIADILLRVGSDKILLEGNSAALLGGAQLDLGGIAKGAAGDSVAKTLRARGITSAIVNLGGNVHLIGARHDGQPWKIGIRAPRGGGILGIVTVQDCAVVTSGMYERNFIVDGYLYHHIMDPTTGRPAESGLVSVTIVSQEGMLADALSTGFFVMGAERAVDFWRKHGGFETILVTFENAILVSEGIAESFTPEYAYSNIGVWVITKDSEYTPLLSEYIGADAVE